MLVAVVVTYASDVLPVVQVMHDDFRVVEHSNAHGPTMPCDSIHSAND